eukprot:5502164-Ditylum_brightwellii.AAC.1
MILFTQTSLKQTTSQLSCSQLLPQHIGGHNKCYQKGVELVQLTVKELPQKLTGPIGTVFPSLGHTINNDIGYSIHQGSPQR